MTLKEKTKKSIHQVGAAQVSERLQRHYSTMHICLYQHSALVVVQGVLRKGQEIEIRPGIVTKDAEGRAACIPIYSRIITLLAEQNDLQYAVPGGLIGVGTTVSALSAS